LRDAVKSSRKFEQELQTLRILSKNDSYINSQISILEKPSKHGISDIHQLKQELASISEIIFKKERENKQNKSLLDKTAINLSSVVHIQKISGDDGSKKPEDIIARSNSYIETGKLDLAIKELSYLTDADKILLNDWVEKARSNLASQEAAENIFQHVIAYN